MEYTFTLLYADGSRITIHPDPDERFLRWLSERYNTMSSQVGATVTTDHKEVLGLVTNDQGRQFRGWLDEMARGAALPERLGSALGYWGQESLSLAESELIVARQIVRAGMLAQLTGRYMDQVNGELGAGDGVTTDDLVETLAGGR